MPSQSNVYQNIYYLISRNKQAKKTRIKKSKKSKENKEEKRTSGNLQPTWWIFLVNHISGNKSVFLWN